jgi:hypothetical protein
MITKAAQCVFTLPGRDMLIFPLYPANFKANENKEQMWKEGDWVTTISFMRCEVLRALNVIVGLLVCNVPVCL